MAVLAGQMPWEGATPSWTGVEAETLIPAEQLVGRRQFISEQLRGPLEGAEEAGHPAEGSPANPSWVGA